MILWHGSNVAVSQPDTLHSRDRVDFGRGFYATPLREQAARLCARYVRLGEKGILSRYEFDEKAATGFSCLSFPGYGDDWLSFVLKCRRGEDDTSFDIVRGGVANDKVFNTVELFFNGLLPREEALKRLRYEKPNEQICFRSQRAIDACLRFTGTEAP